MLKYTILTITMLSALIGGFGQLITLNDTFVQYNAYLQLAVGFSIFIWLAHKVIQRAEQSKPITNARDTKK